MLKRIGLALAAVAALGAMTGPAPDEKLVVQPYPGLPVWKRITDKSGPQGWIHEQIPADRRIDDYSDMLTDQGFVANRGGDPSAFLKAIFANVSSACSGVKVSGPIARIEGGLRVAYGQVRCGTERGQTFGVHIFYKAIGGDAALYSISREFRVPASTDGDRLSFPKAQAAKAAALLKAEAVADQFLVSQVYVCGGRSNDPKCR